MSEKRLNETLSTETEKQVVRPILMAEFDFDTNVERAWTGVGELVWDSKTFYGTGNLGKVSKIEETTEMKATGASFQLSAIPAELIEDILAAPIQGHSAKMWFALMDEDFQNIIDEPHLIHDGRLDTSELIDTGDTATITLNSETRFRDLERPRTKRYTDAEQQKRYPGDKGLEYVPSMQDKEITLGAPKE
ncbi:MAG: hypothetical protein H6859_00430 [Rhodospirillales bacterium]|nr:hypothetical protein [Alphaproteobacteria bacterium]USO05708.1 MAG: hypothetical protein H6859_00430 [Rhodospirillales bacterium]